MGNNMRIGLISHEGGGISSVSYGLASSLAKKKVHATIFTGSPKTNCQVERRGDYLDIVRLPVFDFPPRPLWFQILNSNRMPKLLAEYTIIHGISPEASFGLTFFRSKLKRPFVATVHGSARAFQREFIRSPVTSWTLSDFGNHIVEFPFHDFATNRCLVNSDHAVVCSYTALGEIAAYTKLNMDKTSVIYNGVDFSEIDRLGNSEINRDNKLIIFAGRLVWTKGIMFLLQAFRKVIQESKDAELRIFGKGPMENNVRRFISDYRLGKSVRLCGRISHKDLIVEIKKSDVAVLPSLYEAQPMFALEAMACKKPVVVFDFPYARELITDMKTGVLCTACNFIDLAEKILLLLSDENLQRRLGQMAYDYVSEKHDWDIQAEKYIEVYKETLEEISQIE